MSTPDEELNPCPNCEGTKVIEVYASMDPAARLIEECCPACHGTGYQKNDMQPDFMGVPKRKLDQLLEEGFRITGFAIERHAEGTEPARGFINVGGLVGWWTPNTDAEIHKLRAQVEALSGKPIAPESKYLCKAWGETDLPSVAVVQGLDQVRQFLVDEWLGEDGEDAESAVRSMEAHWELEGDCCWSAEFEIGGISVQKVDLAMVHQARPSLTRPAVPEGWKLVPVVPTEEMCDAGVRAEIPGGEVAFGRENIHSYDDAEAVFRAMLAAAPQPEGGAQ